MILLLTTAFFGIFFFMMGIGFFLRGTVLKGSCGGATSLLGEGCGTCAKKVADICPTDDDTGLLALSQISNPQRSLKDQQATSFDV